MKLKAAGFIDSLVSKLATRVGGTTTRRHTLIRFASLVSAGIGASFAMAVVIETGMAAPKDSDPNNEPDPKAKKEACDHDPNPCGVAGVRCASFTVSTDVVWAQCGAGCKDPKTGCPNGTKPGAAWSACCKCYDKKTKMPINDNGELISFQDCCAKDSSKVCGDIECAAKVNAAAGSECQGDKALCHPKKANIKNFSPWCGNTSQIGTVVASQAKLTGRSCDPATFGK